MTKHDVTVTFQQMLRYAQEAVFYLQDKTQESFDNDYLLQLAITKLLEMLGEAARRVPDDVPMQYPQLPWMQTIAFRNR